MNKKINSNLFYCHVVHKRFIPFQNNFKYSVLSLYLDYDELKLIDKKVSIFSYNKFNLFSFYDCDHGYRNAKSLKEYVVDILKENNIKFNELKIKILCFPRILGYVFNPLSIIFCFNKNNLISILYEVKNTSNEQHTYCFGGNENFEKSFFKHKCCKLFYVSPFINMQCLYQFCTSIPSEKIKIIIEQFNTENKKILLASQIGKKICFTSKNLISYLFKNPLIPIKVIFTIHYQALKILFKGGKYLSRVKKDKDSISFEGRL